MSRLKSKSAGQLDREIAEALSRTSHAQKRWRGTEVQSLIFTRPQWTPSTAKAWAREHGYQSPKVHVTDNYVRLRQFAPITGTQKRTITFGDGIKAVIEQVK